METVKEFEEYTAEEIKELKERFFTNRFEKWMSNWWAKEYVFTAALSAFGKDKVQCAWTGPKEHYKLFEQLAIECLIEVVKKLEPTVDNYLASSSRYNFVFREYYLADGGDHHDSDFEIIDEICDCDFDDHVKENFKLKELKKQWMILNKVTREFQNFAHAMSHLDTSIQKF